MQIVSNLKIIQSGLPPTSTELEIGEAAFGMVDGRTEIFLNSNEEVVKYQAPPPSDMATITYVNNAAAILQQEIDNLNIGGVIRGSVPTYNDLLALDTTNMAVNTMYIVESDITHDSGSTVYTWDGDGWVFTGKFGVEVKIPYRTVVLTPLGWTNNEQTISGLTIVDLGNVSMGLPVPTTRTNADAAAQANIIITALTPTSITFNAKKTPDENIILVCQGVI